MPSAAKLKSKMTRVKFHALISSWDEMNESVFAQQHVDSLLEEIIVAFATVPESDAWYSDWKRSRGGRSPRSI